MSRRSQHRQIHVMLVEDNPGDVDLILEILNKSAYLNRVTVAEDGVAALELLVGNLDLPDLMILDLNLPKKDGRAVLREMRADRRLRQLPVVVLSSSEADRDVTDAYMLQANCFVTKPADLDEFFAAVQSIEQFWLGQARLPRPSERRADDGG